MTDGKCQMTDGKCQMAESECRMPSDEWQMAEGGDQMAEGGGRGADDECGVSSGGWAAGESSQPAAQQSLDVPAGAATLTPQDDQESKKAPNEAKLETTQNSSSQELESAPTDPAGGAQTKPMREGSGKSRAARSSGQSAVANEGEKSGGWRVASGEGGVAIEAEGREPAVIEKRRTNPILIGATQNKAYG
jgi:hypothetical protein